MACSTVAIVRSTYSLTTRSRTERRALAARGMELPRYLEIRAAYREWKRVGGRSRGDPLTDALERRRVQLRAADLGRYDSLDL